MLMHEVMIMQIRKGIAAFVIFLLLFCSAMIANGRIERNNGKKVLYEGELVEMMNNYETIPINLLLEPFQPREYVRIIK